MGTHALSLDDPAVQAFWRERHLCTVTMMKPDGRPHVIPMGVVLQPGTSTAWAITRGGSFKTRIIEQSGTVAVCQVDGGRWITLYGTASICSDAASIAEAVRLYSERYRTPRPSTTRVAVQINVERVEGHA